MTNLHPGQDPAGVLKPLHPRAARPVLERVFAQGLGEVFENETLQQLYDSLLAETGPTLPAEAHSLIQRFAKQPGERERILEQLLRLNLRKP